RLFAFDERPAAPLLPRVPVATAMWARPPAQWSAGDSDARQARNVVEVRVSTEQNQIMLDGESRNPQIVGGNRATLLPQCRMDIGVEVRGLFVRSDDASAGHIQETREQRFIVGTASSIRETSAQLRQDDERHADLLRRANDLDCVLVTDTEVRVSVRVDGELHRQSFSSMERCSAISRSSALASARFKDRK